MNETKKREKQNPPNGEASSIGFRIARRAVKQFPRKLNYFHWRIVSARASWLPLEMFALDFDKDDTRDAHIYSFIVVVTVAVAY